MLYTAYEAQKNLLAGASALANISAQWLQNPVNPFGYSTMGPLVASGLDVFAHAAAPRGKPAFGLTETVVDGKTVAITEEIVLRKPFGQLKHFRKEGVTGQPRLLIVAPMSGHYATLLRGTVERLLHTQDVYITDWHDARDVSLNDGNFDLDDYIDYVIDFVREIGPGAHLLAVCQPTVPAFAATALMNATNDPCAPATMTMMGGPIDTRESPTAVNQLATERPLSWFEHNVVATVPQNYAGAGRRVYPGFMQLAGFMTMNLGNHLMSHWEMFKHLVAGDDESADATKAFYDEYRAVCDMDAAFYLQTVDVVFQNHKLPKGELMHRETLVDARAITRTALLAIEGENDDISGLGQTKAALNISTNLPAELKKYMIAEHVGHYGIFNGRRWREEIAPVVEEWIASHTAKTATAAPVCAAPVAAATVTSTSASAKPMAKTATPAKRAAKPKA
ncbi:polyhydroxyalkanoate depolymerase [Aquisediminimonas sediminicola]|uniref:polyhydroxyalkanoate depolymerase n=1 Tax=Alteraquisediminimonas sediminicola TaxID=2676787 RepID=UPI001C8E4236|nr:polyhydroxyalkanoate depolymerase [Aquisediminimonas sediminicola]